MRSISERIPLLLLGALFLPEVAGLYAAADRLIRLPVQGFTQAVRKVFAQRAAVRRRSGASLLPVLALATVGLAVLGAVPFGLVALYSKPLFAVVLGERWAGAGDYAQAIALWGFSLFLVGPANATLMVLERQRSQLVVNTLRVCLFAGVAAVAVIAALDPLTAVQLFALAGIVSNLALVVLALVVAAGPSLPPAPSAVTDAPAQVAYPRDRSRPDS